MNQLAFGLKRAYYSYLRISHQTLRPFDLTPARFEMLRYIAEIEGMAQNELASALGVRASTVSRMLKALVEMGLVEKQVGLDARSRSIGLTSKGRALVREVLARVVGSGMASLLQNAAGSWAHSPRAQACHVDRFFLHLRWVRLACGDKSIRFDDWPHDLDSALFRRPLALLRTPEIADDRLFGIGKRSKSAVYTEPFRAAG